MRIGVALGSGAARGLAHIPYIEALDELGIRPTVIAGASIGALIGSGWANGMTGAELREHAYAVLGGVQQIATTLLTRNRVSLQSIFANGISMQMDGLAIAGAFLPEGFPEDFSALDVPFKVVATDAHSAAEVLFESGPLVPAIAASMSIPGVFRPTRVNGRFLIDGGVTNPLPVDHLHGLCDLTIGIDVQRLRPLDAPPTEPSMLDVAVMATEIMSQRLVDATVRQFPPNLYLRADSGPFGVAEFWRVKEIIEHATGVKDQFKRAVDGAIAVWQMGKLA